jgi:drug/metabolite transporter (DMT)-like permease
LTPVPIGRPTPGDVAALAISGVLGAASFASFYRALQLGPVSLVSPMFSAYSAVAVILAVAFGAEKLAAAAIAGLVLTIGGVALVSAGGQNDVRPDPRPSSRLRGNGVPYALAAMLSWGVAIYLLGRASEHLGWFLPVVLSRIVTFAIVVFAAAVVGLRHRSIRPRLATLWLPGICGLFDVLAFMAYTRATMGGSVSVPTVASACFPLIVIAGGVLFFRERLRGHQVLGTGMTLAGLLILGLSR